MAVVEPEMVNWSDAHYYQSRKVLVTGGLSFIGSHLVEALVSLGAFVTVADDGSSGREINVESVRPAIHLVKGDLRDAEFSRTVSRGQDLVFHLAAAHGGRGYIDSHPVECLNNMVIDNNVFGAAAESEVEKMIFASSACVYPTVLQEQPEERRLLAEADANFANPGATFPDGDYGWAKLMGELQLRAFYRQRGMQGVACRIFTAYGERENESHAVIALIAKALARLDPYPIWGDGRQDRNFTYVGDTVMGLILAGARLSGYDVVNIGTPLHVTIDDLVAEILAIVDWQPKQIEHQLDKPVGVKSRAADVSKSMTALGWCPSTDLRTGLVRTIDWYRQTVDPEVLQSLDLVLTSR